MYGYRGRYTVGMMARALCITPLSYYDYRKGICGKREARRDDLERRILSYAQAYYRYGAPRIAADIRAEGYQVSTNTVSKYMNMGHKTKYHNFMRGGKRRKVAVHGRERIVS